MFNLNVSGKHPVAADITPETKVGELLDKFPELEDALIEMSPDFPKLRNPVLRRTVAKIANLKQVAKVGRLPLSDLINSLRKQAGIDTEYRQAEAAAGGNGRPAWVNPDKLAETLDAREMLADGGHPVNQVMASLNHLKEQEVYLLITPFFPAPLIDRAKAKGFKSWTEEVSDTEIKTYFCR